MYEKCLKVREESQEDSVGTWEAALCEIFVIVKNQVNHMWTARVCVSMCDDADP